MNFYKYDNLKKAKKALLERGYIHQFEVKNKLLINRKNKKIYLPQDLTIAEYHRFGNKSKAKETTLVFAIECKDKSKGIIISTYGDYADMTLIKYMDKVKIKPRSVSIATS